MSKKCSRRCGRRHIVKTRKTLHVGSTFGRSTAPHKTTTTTLHYIPLHPAVVGEVTTATTPKSTTPTTFRSINGFALSVKRHNNQTSSIGFLFLKLPPPPCEVLLVYRLYINNSDAVCVKRRGCRSRGVETPPFMASAAPPKTVDCSDLAATVTAIAGRAPGHCTVPERVWIGDLDEFWDGIPSIRITRTLQHWMQLQRILKYSSSWLKAKNFCLVDLQWRFPLDFRSKASTEAAKSPEDTCNAL